MKLSKPTFNLNQTATVLAVIVAVVLIGGGAWAGYAAGTDNGKQQAIENPPKRQSLSGEVKSANENGLTVTARGEDWKVKYTDSTKFTATKGGSGQVGKNDIKKGAQVRITGVLDGDKTVIAQTVAKVAPKPSGSPVPGQPAAQPRAGKPAPQQD